VDDFDFQIAPLHWPSERPRTPAKRRKPGPFRTELMDCLDDVMRELRLLGARYVTISWNVEGHVRRGRWRPYNDLPEIEDPGAAVYFDLDGDPVCFSCDKWEHPEDNLRAIGKTIEALRGQQRWGAAEKRQAFGGYRALPPAGPDWRAVFALDDAATIDQVKKRYRELAATAHPDKHEGNEHEMVRLNQAMEAARLELSP